MVTILGLRPVLMLLLCRILVLSLQEAVAVVVAHAREYFSFGIQHPISAWFIFGSEEPQTNLKNGFVVSFSSRTYVLAGSLCRVLIIS